MPHTPTTPHTAPFTCVQTRQHPANPSAYAFQPENTLKLSAWDHNPQDTTLFDLIPFLQMVQEVAVNVSVACGCALNATD